LTTDSAASESRPTEPVSSHAAVLHPQPIDDVGVGLAVSVSASLINLAVGILLLRAGRRAGSIVLEADGRHLITDVWTSVGVVIGVAGVAITGWERLDALIALAVAVIIVATGSRLVRRSAGGLMDRALGEPERRQIQDVLDRFERDGVQFHALRTRQAGSRAFLSVHVLVSRLMDRAARPRRRRRGRSRPTRAAALRNGLHPP